MLTRLVINFAVVTGVFVALAAITNRPLPEYIAFAFVLGALSTGVRYLMLRNT